MLPKVTTVTSAALRDMAIGESRTFKLPDHEPYLSRAVNNGKSIAYRLQRELECRRYKQQLRLMPQGGSDSRRGRRVYRDKQEHPVQTHHAAGHSTLQAERKGAFFQPPGTGAVDDEQPRGNRSRHQLRSDGLLYEKRTR